MAVSNTIESSGNYSTQVNTYDVFNRLIKVEAPGITADYGYNYDGLRAYKTVNGVTNKFIWDGSNIVVDVGLNGSVNDIYIRGLFLLESEQNGYYLHNAHGDVVQLTNSAGIVAKNYSYDAFGVEEDANDNDTNPFKYCGEYFDLSTGTYYLRARY